MNKKFLIFVFFLFFVFIISLIFGIFIMYRFSIVQDVSRKINENLKKDNYHMKTTITESDGSVTNTEVFYRNDVGKLIASNGIYTWTDGKYAYMIDEEKKEAYILNIENENIGLVSYDMYATVIPGYKESIGDKILIAGNLKNTIKKSEIDNKECFIIKIVSDNYSKTVWVDTIKATPIKAEIEFNNGNKINYSYEIIFNETRLKDIELPKINEYTVINTETNDVIMDNVNINGEVNNNESNDSQLNNDSSNNINLNNETVN